MSKFSLFISISNNFFSNFNVEIIESTIKIYLHFLQRCKQEIYLANCGFGMDPAEWLMPL